MAATTEHGLDAVVKEHERAVGLVVGGFQLRDRSEDVHGLADSDCLVTMPGSPGRECMEPENRGGI